MGETGRGLIRRRPAGDIKRYGTKLPAHARDELSKISRQHETFLGLVPGTSGIETDCLIERETTLWDGLVQMTRAVRIRVRTMRR